MRIFKLLLVFALSFFSFKKSFAGHGMALINYSATIGVAGVTINAQSQSPTCGGGPYWLQTEIRCTPGQLTGTPPGTMQTQLLTWPAVPPVVFNQFPWYNSLLNVPGYGPPGWADQCINEPYHAQVISFVGLCPGQVYYFASREWVSGTNSVGPWTAVQSFTVPGVFTPLNYVATASPSLFCSPGSSTLSITGVVGGCGSQTVTWQPGNVLTPSFVVSPAVTTQYTAFVSTPCQTLTQVVTVSVIPVISASFTPLNATNCVNVPVQFNHTGTPGVIHNWGVVPGLGVTIVSTNSPSPTITFANTGTYVVTHTVNLGGCVNTVSTNIFINSANAAFTIPTATQCLSGNAFNFNATFPAGVHTYSFNPPVGAPPVGNTPNYGPVGFTIPGTYTVTHSVVVGACTNFSNMVVVVSPQPSMTISFTNASCGLNNGKIVINNTSPPPQTISGYSLNGVAIASPTVINLAAGVYTVSLKNNSGCITTGTVQIFNTPAITALATTSINPSCGNNNGVITLGAVTGGAPTFSFSVNGGSFSIAPPLTNLAPGVYTLVVLDINGCTFTKTVSLVNQAGPTAINFTTSPTACVGNTGIVGITGVVGGLSPYTFSLNGVPCGSVNINLAAGPKTITVADANGCTLTAVANVSTVTGPTAAVVAVQNAACGNANGSATISGVSGGVAPYQYSWNGGAFITNTVQGGMAAGPKVVVVRDVNFCTFTVNFVIGNTGSPVSSVGNFSNVSCFGGNNGSLTLTTVGGTAPYNYTLNPGGIVSGFGIFTNLTAQAYTITVSDFFGCLTTVTTSIGQPSQLTLTLSANQPSCNGGNNGTITATGGGGTSPYQFNLNGGAFQPSGTFTNNITAGAYNVSIVDAKGCTVSQTITVTQPTPISLTLTSINAICFAFNGTANVVASGGTPIYTYTWLPVGGNNAQAVGLQAATYTVIVKDVNQCITNGVVTVSATPGGTAVITNTVHVSCFGLANGSLTANMVGPVTPPLTYSWSNGALTQVNGPLAPGPYTVQVTDFNGCKSNAVGVIIQPGLLTLTGTQSNVACFNGATGTATTSVLSGGTPTFAYLWTPGGANTSTVGGLAAGNYSCLVTDANGCQATRTINITQSTSVTINTNTITATCQQSNGAITATAIGGVGPYTYTWSNGVVGQNLNNVPAGTYTVNVQTANGCISTLAATIPNASGPVVAISAQTNVSCFGGNNGIATATAAGGMPGPGFPTFLWSNFQNTGTATNLMNGVYTVTVTDASGCIGSASVTITQPPAITLNVSGTNPLCFNAINGTGNVGVLGGVGPYTYTWVPSPGIGVNSPNPMLMGPGNYFVNVTDANGCPSTGTLSLSNPPQMVSSVSSTNVTCFNACNGMAVATVTNGVGLMTYLYTGGPSPLTTQSVTNLCAGVYTMLATSQNSCMATTIFTITQPPVLTVSISAVGNVSCSGGNNGFATCVPGGGTPAYSYSWSNGQTFATATGLAAGNYSVLVTDSYSCSAVANVVITQPAGLTATATGTNVTCFGLANGIGNVSYAGGVGIPSILWLPSLGVTQTANNLAPGNHSVTLTDGNGCSLTQTINITQPTQLFANITGTINTNCNQANGGATMTAVGGAGGYSYLWSSNPSFTNTSINNVLAGTYTVIVTDANNCTASAIAIINNIAGPVINAQSSTSVICNGQSNGTAGVTASGGVGVLTYMWSYLAQTTPSVNNLPFGIHSISVTDAMNCITSTTFNIAQPTQVVSAIGGFTNVTCSGANNGTALVLAVGGNPGYTYSWTPSGQNTATLTNVGPGTHTVLVMDVNNCPTTSTVTISQPNPLLITTNTFVNINCNGASTGSINTTINGGTPTYTITWSPVQPPNPIITNLTAGVYSMSVIDTKGCTTNSVYTLTQPAAMVMVSSNTTPATCGNSNGTATIVISGGVSPYAYNWNTPTPILTNTAGGLAPGVWILTTTDNKGCAISNSVSIFAPPLPSVTAAFTAPNCFGQSNGSASLSAFGVSPFTYSWSPGGLTGGTITGVPAALYTATITDGFGCLTYTSVNITQPNILVIQTPSAQTICYGTNGNVYAASSGGTPPYTYTWVDPTAVITGTTGGPFNNTYTTTSQYTVSVVDSKGCSDGPRLILVNVTPQLIIASQNYTACSKDEVLLTPTITSPGNGGPYTYAWSGAGGGTGTEKSVIADFATNPNTYTVTVSDGCTLPNGSTVFNITVRPLPTATWTSTEKQGCAPLTVLYEVTGDSTTTNSKPFVWSFTGGNEPKALNTPTMLIVYPDAGTYSLGLVITNKYGCKTKYEGQFASLVYPLPIADFVPNPATTSIIEPTVSFSNLSQGGISYSWDFADYDYPTSNTSSEENPVHLYNLVGIYNVFLRTTNEYGCIAIANHTIEITPELAVYIPNAFTPDDNKVNDTFQPKGVGINEDRYKMEIFDRWGGQIFTSNAFRTGWDGKLKGSQVKAEDGVYIYKISLYDLLGNHKYYTGTVTLLNSR